VEDPVQLIQVFALISVSSERNP